MDKIYSVNLDKQKVHKALVTMKTNHVQCSIGGGSEWGQGAYNGFMQQATVRNLLYLAESDTTFFCLNPAPHTLYWELMGSTWKQVLTEVGDPLDERSIYAWFNVAGKNIFQCRMHWAWDYSIFSTKDQGEQISLYSPSNRIWNLGYLKVSLLAQGTSSFPNWNL